MTCENFCTSYHFSSSQPQYRGSSTFDCLYVSEFLLDLSPELIATGMKRGRAKGTKGPTDTAKRHKGDSTEPRKLRDDEIDEMLENVATGQSELSSQNQSINKLKKQVTDLQSTVTVLRSQIEFLMSALGCTLKPTDDQLNGPGSQHTANVPNESTASNSAGQSVAFSGSSTANTSWTEVVRHPAKTQRAVRDAVVAAVYVDQQRKNNRVANLVVSGLQPTSQVPDSTVVANLLSNEIGIVPKLVHCRRLGKLTPNKPQPLLIVLHSAEQADEIMSRAKRLRSSVHSVVREHVYINRHLTDAESRAAFELRSQRRANKELNVRRTRDKTSTAGMNAAVSVGSSSQSDCSVSAPSLSVPTVGAAASIDMSLELESTDPAMAPTVASHSLRVNAADFQPSAATGSM